MLISSPSMPSLTISSSIPEKLLTNPLLTKLNFSDSQKSAIGLGCMGLSGVYGPGLATQTDFNAFVIGSLRQGIRLFDTARVYNQTLAEGAEAESHNERMLGLAIEHVLSTGEYKREEIIIATKCGLAPDLSAVLFDASHIHSACTESLKNLKIDSIDLYYLHRMPKSLAQFTEALDAFANLVRTKKIQHMGLSEASPEYIRFAYAYFKNLMETEADIFTYNPLASIETEFSIFSPGPLRHVSEGQKSLIATCTELGLIFTPYASMCRGLLTDQMNKNFIFDTVQGDVRQAVLPRFQGKNFEENLKIKEALQALIAEEKLDCSLAQLALAWSLKMTESQNCFSILIPGTTSLARLVENQAALKVVPRLSPKILEKIDIICPHGAFGNRYPEAWCTLHNLPPSPVHEYSSLQTKDSKPRESFTQVGGFSV